MCSFNGLATPSIEEIYTSTHRSAKITHHWCVTNYSSYRVPIDGPVFSVHHLMWHLRVYPQGQRRHHIGLLAISAVPVNTFHIEDGNVTINLKIDGRLIKTAGKKLPSYLVKDMEVSFPDFISMFFTLQRHSSLKLECHVYMKYNVDSRSFPEDTMTLGVSSLVDNFERLFEKKTFSDVAIIAGGKEIPAHRVILAAQSPIFAAMFGNGTAENLTRQVEISDVRHDVLLQMMRFMYTSKTPRKDRITCDLLVAADKYQLDHLKKMCESALL